MKENTIKKEIRNILKLLGFKNEKSFSFFLIFVVISFIFWFLVELSKEYTSIIDYPIKISSLPDDKILISEVPDNIQLKITGKGFDLLKYELASFIFPYIINYEEITNHNHSDNFQLQTSIIFNDIRNKFPSNIEIKEIFPKKISFVFSSSTEKKVPVKVNISYRLAKQYVIRDKIIILPDSVVVKGVRVVLDTLSAVYSKQYNLKILDKPVKKILTLKKIPFTSFSTKKVTLFINVQQYTEATIRIPIVMKNLPDSLSIKFIPDKVTVKYKSTLDDFNKIHPDQFKATVNYSSILENNNNSRIPVYFEVTPKKAFDISLLQNKVSFLLTHKQKK